MKSMQPILILLLCAAALPVAAKEAREVPGGGALEVDFRYAPHWWQTSICLPDDWQKTLVGKEGTLLYDYSGKFSGFKTRIGFDIDGGTEWVKQELVSPRVPIVRTIKEKGDLRTVEETFAAPPSSAAKKKPGVGKIELERVGTGRGETNWASPKGDCDPAFTSIAVGWNGSVQYRFRSAGKQTFAVVLGLCEGHHEEAGKRILDLQVEGKTRDTVDMVSAYGKNVPAVFPFSASDENGDGWIEFAVTANEASSDKNSILNVVWVFEGEPEIEKAKLLAGSSTRSALAFLDCGPGLGPSRNDVMLVHIANTGDSASDISPQFTIESEQPFSYDVRKKTVAIGQGLSLTCTHPFEVIDASPEKLVLRLASIEVPAGRESLIALGVASGSPRRAIPRSVGQADKLRAAAETYWGKADLPFGRIEVPDPSIQALVDSSIRNIYQAREIKNGLPAYQVGPTVYRGLWIVDGAFLLEAATYLGHIDDVRRGIEYMLSYQRDDGGFEIIKKYWKESGIVIWAVTRHARLTGDKEWLRGHWPKLERAFAFILKLRDEASQDPNAPYYGLIPPGFPDGGLGGRDDPEYTNVYWTMVGMKAAIDAARWLGKDDEAAEWQKEYDAFYAAFEKAAKRDMLKDGHGNPYLPIIMQNKGNHLPQRAQWAFCHAVFPGKVFAPDDPLVAGNMAMLEATEREGMVYGTGWMADGLWNYFASFYGHAWLWMGKGRKAAEVLYAFANHAAPTLLWCEEQSLVDAEKRSKHGDMPHNWASAEFIRLVRHSLVLERGDELHLFEGMPAEWAKPGAVTRMRDVLTAFGPISLELKVADDGKSARLQVDPPTRERPSAVVVHLTGWAAPDGTDAVMKLSGEKRIVRQIPLE